MVNIQYINTILLNTVPYQKVKNTAFDEFVRYMAYIGVICVKTKLTENQFCYFNEPTISNVVLLVVLLGFEKDC